MVAPRDLIDIDAAFQFLLQRFGQRDLARQRMITALHSGDINLYIAVNNKLTIVSPSFVDTHLTVWTKTDAASGRHHAEIRATRALDGTYEYRVSRGAVVALCALPESPKSDTQTNKQWRRSPRGAPSPYDWEKILIEAASLIHDEGPPATFEEFWQRVAAVLGDDSPKDTQLKKHLAPLYERVRHGLSKT
jgi:hypothetical protein